MSGRSCTSGGGSTSGSVRLHHATHEIVLDALYERKRDKKSVRVLTVIIYVFSVSLAAIMLSLYYVFFWEPKDAQYAQRKVAHTVDLQLQTSTTPLPTCLMPHTGGGNSTMSEELTTPTLDPSSLPASNDPPDLSQPPFDAYTQTSSEVNMTNPWPTWIMTPTNDTGLR